MTEGSVASKWRLTDAIARRAAATSPAHTAAPHFAHLHTFCRSIRLTHRLNPPIAALGGSTSSFAETTLPVTAFSGTPSPLGTRTFFGTLGPPRFVPGGPLP